MKAKKNNQKKTKKVIYFQLLIFLLLAIAIIFYFVNQNSDEQQYNEIYHDDSYPKIELVGPPLIKIDVDEEYKELGIEAYDSAGKDISYNVIIEGSANEKEKGIYLLYYSFVDDEGNESIKLLRRVVVGDVILETDDRKKVVDDELKEIIRIEIIKHEDELRQFKQSESDCEKVNYLKPFINEYYGEENRPPRSTLRPAIRAILNEDDPAYLSAFDEEGLANIIEELLEEHEVAIIEFEEEFCSLTNYLLPYVYDYYDEKNYPSRNLVQTVIEKKLGGD